MEEDIPFEFCEREWKSREKKDGVQEREVN